MERNLYTMKYFSSMLLEWYSLHKRDLPWRRSRNPFHIWVSEIMLQQTRVDTVIPYFHRFIEKFPDIDALASAPEEEVLKAWEGLGYYSRARNLQSAVKEVREQYGGEVPRRKQDISALKGVGPYTAGAILSIAFNQPEPAVDGNVMRVLSRYFYIEEDIGAGSTRAYMEHLIRDLIPEGTASDFNQALMELGALVCTPRSPHCLTCPVMEHCSGRIAGAEESLPVKKKAKPPRPEQRVAAFITEGNAGEGSAVKFLIRQRPEEGLLARMWELPHFLLEDLPFGWNASHKQCMDYLQGRMAEQERLVVKPQQWIGNTEHTFSHIHWSIGLYECAIPEKSPSPLPAHYRWIDYSEMDKYAFPKVFLTAIKRLAAGQ
jgi:A/G-specific adenine glycosylase